MRLRSVGALAALVIASTLALAGCSNDSLADQYRDGNGNNFISGDGAVTEIHAQDRSAPVTFTGTDEDGKTISSADFAGRVVVLNFWYAGCAPCRAEAPDLERISQEFASQGASFVGVNVRDMPASASAFSNTFGISYPSIIDTNGAVQLALAGVVAPNAVPTTIVIDKQGRVASRILGQVTEPSTLESLIRDTIAES